MADADGKEHQEEREDSLVKESEIKETGSKQKDMNKNKRDLKLSNKRKKKKEKKKNNGTKKKSQKELILLRIRRGLGHLQPGTKIS